MTSPARRASNSCACTAMRRASSRVSLCVTRYKVASAEFHAVSNSAKLRRMLGSGASAKPYFVGDGLGDGDGDGVEFSEKSAPRTFVRNAANSAGSNAPVVLSNVYW